MAVFRIVYVNGCALRTHGFSKEQNKTNQREKKTMSKFNGIHLEGIMGVM